MIGNYVVTALLLLLAPAGARAGAPAAPWDQHGTAYVQLVDVPLDVAERCVSMPDVFDVVPTKKGGATTSGSIYVAKYDNTSTVEYSELIFICAEVQHKGTGVKANWVHSIHVDSEAAKDAGINVWHLPKKLAEFEWDRPTSPDVQHVKISTLAENASIVAEMSFDDKAFAIPWQSQTIQTFSVDVPKQLLYLSQTKQKYAVKLLKSAYVNVPEGSPMFDVYNASTLDKTKVAMTKATFEMTAPSSVTPLKPGPAPSPGPGPSETPKSRAAKMFETTPERTTPTPLKFEGNVPAWFKGTLIRNSPGGYENGDDHVRHWNDGWAQLHRWRIDGSASTVDHMSRFLNTSSYFAASTLGAIKEAGYGTPANPGPRPHKPIPLPPQEQEEVVQAESPGPSIGKFAINPMVNVWKFDNKFMATTDQNLFVEFDPDTLSTVDPTPNGGWQPDDPLTKKGVLGIGVAHGRYDRWSKEHYWLEIDMGMVPVVGKTKYNVWTYQETGFNGTGPIPTDRKILGTIEDKHTSFVHSFGLSAKYIVIIQCPMYYHFLEFVTAKTVLDTISWDDKTATKFHVMDRATGEVVTTFDAEDGAWFVYHIANAFDSGEGEITIDFSKYQNDTLISYGMFLENIVDHPKQYVPTYSQARMTRCVITLANGGSAKCEQVIENTFEMGTFNVENFQTKKYTYAWGASFEDANTPWHNGTSDFIDKLIKVNVDTKEVEASWHRPGFYVCEPLFQQNPAEGSREDDGVLMFVGFNSSSESSRLFLLNGTDMTELGSADMGARLAANFHGKWMPDGKDYAIGL